MYAQKTKVPVDRTRSEIEQMLLRAGATGFMFGSTAGQAMIVFEMNDRRLKFLLPIPVPSRSMSEEKAKSETRRRWRALLLVLKAKLEAVASSIVEFDVEFLPFVVVRGNETVGEQMVPQLDKVLASGELPHLLGPGTTS
jgi:hypothetical protein